MSNMNKYFETQLALSKQCESKHNKKQNTISTKSKSVAEYISQKQTKSLTKHLYRQNKDHSIFNPIKSNEGDLDELEDDADLVLPFNSSRTRHNINRILDDGDCKQFNMRIQKWQKNLKRANNGTSKFDNTTITADIQYILNGNKIDEQMHKLQNGLMVQKYIWKQLYKFQKNGVKWLWKLHQIESGGLLGDKMGLGKTIQTIAFLAGLSKSNLGAWSGLGPCIIVAPATVLYQWVSLFHYWCPPLRVAVLHHTGSHSGKHHKLIRDIQRACGILLVTYAGVVKYHKELIGNNWHYLILDEGHKIRNPDTQVRKYVRKIKTPHRILITGSPMQNSLQELWSLFDFMRPGLLGTCNAFTEHFAVPITQGGYANATEIQVATALEIATALKYIITPYMLRRTKAEVQDHIKLPENNEQVLFCPLTHEQRDLYMGYLTSRAIKSILAKDKKYNSPSRARLLIALSTLRKICNHPDIYLNEAQSSEENTNEEKFTHWKRSGKMTVVHSLLKIWQKQGHRALVFSQSRVMLCILEQYLQAQGFQYLRMDGTVNVSQRQNMIKTFNENSDYLVFLSTTRVGGLGLNLTGADRVIIYDPDWNPATDEQAKERAWRIGQARDVTVYRLISAGTVEEKIYQRQIFKQFLRNKVFVDPNQKNYLTTNALQGLFSLENLNREEDTETTIMFKHTEINNPLKVPQKDGISTLENKKETMKTLAKNTSKKIFQDAKVTEKTNVCKVNEKEISLHRTGKKSKFTLVDDKNINLSADISEKDIIKMHAKKDYEAKLLKKEILRSETQKLQEPQKSNESDLNTTYNENNRITTEKMKEKLKKKRKSSIMEDKVSVKKFKKEENIKNKSQSDDDYVLKKLFAKAAVKNALQHDVIISLAEPEKKHKMKEIAVERARNAVRAVKFSYK